MSYIVEMTRWVDKVSSEFTESLTEETKLLMWLETELRDCRNELCLKCGCYNERSDGKTLLAGDKLDIFYEYVEELMGRPLYTYELFFLSNIIKEKSKPDFINLCKGE